MRPVVLVAGGGMAGLVAAARVADLGAAPRLYEKGTRLGGSMLLSSGVVWRHAAWADFRDECPGGVEPLQRSIWERLDDALEWLRRLGAPVVAPATGNPRTVGARFDTAGLRDALVARLPPECVVRAPAPLDGDTRPTVLATGGFAAAPELVDRYIKPGGPLRLRAAAWSTGDGLLHATGLGAALTSGMDEFYGRNMPAAPWSERQFVPLAQLYAGRARILDEDGVEFFHAHDVSWSETNVVQATAQRRNSRAFYLLDRQAIDGAPGLAERLAAVPAVARLEPDELPFPTPTSTVLAVHVQASITHTIGGLAVDDRARVLDGDGRPLEGLFAAGVDVGGVATGGYSSGLAQALVLGLAAAEAAVSAGT